MRVAAFYDAYGSLGCVTSHLTFFRRTPPDLRSIVLAQDIVHVDGGNTRTMLAVWRDWGLDDVLREAYARGVVLCGSSAGSICWFEDGITDSVDGELGPIRGIGLLSGSHCPHYDAEPGRRPAYRQFVAGRAVSPGVAADDGVALHYVDENLASVVSSRPSAAAYRVELDGDGAKETRLAARLLEARPLGERTHP
jgi:peptidase E